MIQLLLLTRLLFFTASRTSTNIGHAPLHLPQVVQSTAFTGVIFKIENLDKSPDTEINGQKVLQYVLLPQKPENPIPIANIRKFSPTIQYRACPLIAGLLIDAAIAPIKINPTKYDHAITSFLFRGFLALLILS